MSPFLHWSNVHLLPKQHYHAYNNYESTHEHPRRHWLHAKQFGHSWSGMGVLKGGSM